MPQLGFFYSGCESVKGRARLQSAFPSTVRRSQWHRDLKPETSMQEGCICYSLNKFHAEINEGGGDGTVPAFEKQVT